MRPWGVLQVLAEAVLFGAAAARPCDVEFGLSVARIKRRVRQMP